MRDHKEWRASWLGPRSEYTYLESHYQREENRHAMAALLGALTAIACAVGLIYLMS